MTTQEKKRKTSAASRQKLAIQNRSCLSDCGSYLKGDALSWTRPSFALDELGHPLPVDAMLKPWWKFGGGAGWLGDLNLEKKLDKINCSVGDEPKKQGS
eukprot:m.80940 g.80940  ORF g.80940 m.80940 type:complete len:99 (-) comp14228_c0_seq2:117-413(-)